MIDPWWILLDNQSSAVMFSNHWLVQNILHAEGHWIMIHWNCDKLHVMREAILKGYMTIRFDEGAIVNIIYFRRIRDKHPVYYDTEEN